MKLKEYKLDELYVMDSGISTTKEQAGHGASFVSFRDIFNNIILPDKLTEKMDTTKLEQEKYSVKKGDVFFTRTSETIDELAMSSVALKDYNNATFSGFAKRLRPIANDIVYDKFMAFFFRSKYFRKIIDYKAIMTLRASFNEDIFSYIKVMLPDYNHQLKSGDLLYAIEKKINNNNNINRELEKLAKTIYDYWFLQFDFPDLNGKPYKTSGGKMVWNDELKKEIPEDWKVQNLKENDFTEIINPGIERFKDKKTYIATGDVNGNDINGGSNITYEKRESRANMQPIPNSVWFAKMKNSIKHIYVGKYSKMIIENNIFSTGFLGLKCLNENYLEYINCFINSSYFETKKNQLAHGATQEAVNNHDIRLIQLLIPNSKIIEKFHQITQKIFEEININNEENNKLSELKDFLVPLLINGQVTFKNK